MEQFKRAQVIILPTEQYTNLCLGHNLSYVESKNSISIDAIWKSIELQYQYKPQHLYIISEDEIKEDDWCMIIDKTSKLYGQFEQHKGKHQRNEQWKKIISTTDTSLNYETPFYGMDEDNNFPQPSQQFITKYIEEYNKGNIIDSIMVEYEQDYTNRNCSTCNLGTDGTCELNLEKKCCSSTNNVTKHGDYWISCLDGEEDSEIYKIKVASKDSSITIKKLKDSWNREEVIEQIWSAYKAANTVFEDESALRIEFDNWIDQNL